MISDSFYTLYYFIISYQISFSSVPVQIFQAVIILSPSICLQFLVGFAFGTFSAQLAPCIVSCVETRFKRTVKSKVENHGKFIFWHLQVRFSLYFFASFCTFRCIFLFATRSTSHSFNPTILQGTDVWKDLRLSCWGHWGHDRISHPLILMTCVVVVGMSQSILCQQQLFPQPRCPFHFQWMILVVCVCIICMVDWCPIFCLARQQWSEIFLDKSNWMETRCGCLDAQRGADEKHGSSDSWMFCWMVRETK